MTQLLLICPNCRKMVEADADIQRWTACSPTCFEALNPGHKARRIGEKAPRISADVARAIYLSEGRQVDIARQFNVPAHVVRDVRAGRAYADEVAGLEPPPSLVRYAGKGHTDEVRARMSEVHKGKPKSEDTIAAMRVAAKARWANPDYRAVRSGTKSAV